MDLLYQACLGLSPKRIPHYEHWSCPDGETYLTGIDFYDHPKLCREKLLELYPGLSLNIPPTDTPIPRPTLGSDDVNSSMESNGGLAVRWGEGESWHWDWGKSFKSVEEALAFSPLEHADFTNIPVVESRDYSDEDKLYKMYRAGFPAEWGDEAPEGLYTVAGFYNTMFMWPLLTFGWELFLEMCLDPRFERIMDEFAEINRRVFRTFARLPAKFVLCHDDIVNARGPVCSPAWMAKYIFPRYEEFWSIVKAAGKEVIFIADGCMDAYADDVLACGARGIITEPFTDFKAIARKHENVTLAGEGDNRILSRNDPDEIRAMVESMVETGRITGGYMMCIGNHIPWNVTPEGIKRYLDLCQELAWR
jgi:hypothetical protein